MIEITYDINKQFGKRFTDFRSEEFVNVQYTFRRILTMFGIATSTCNGTKTTFGTNYEINAVASELQESEMLGYLKSELEEDKVTYNQDENTYTCLIPCRPYIINPVTKEKIEADDFDLTINITFFRTVEEMMI